MALTLNWVKCGIAAGSWCPFATVDLSKVNVTGVYVIWQGNQSDKPGLVVKVGQGDVADRIAKHRIDTKIIAYEDLLVTWASVDARSLGGVERYLGEQLNPVVAERFPQDPPIAVNLPGK